MWRRSKCCVMAQTCGLIVRKDSICHLHGSSPLLELQSRPKHCLPPSKKLGSGFYLLSTVLILLAAYQCALCHDTARLIHNLQSTKHAIVHPLRRVHRFSFSNASQLVFRKVLPCPIAAV